VEVIDLWPPLLAARAKGDAPEPIYQRQDTHWSSRGLLLTAKVLAERVRQYPWWKERAGQGVSYTRKETTFSRYGDVYSRLPERDKRGLKPESLAATQVLRPDGQPFEPDAESPIVVLGDSYGAVYELIDCQHAGVAAQLAAELGHSVDLVMSYGGGPTVRKTLMRAGEALGKKRLVIYLMSARDLYAFPDGWEPLAP
jgi:alginate O-acetyltransferase complex protein AlgJ